MNKVGVVFSGGGGKGAYQIGVWKAMEEYELRASVVSGTSVGALNGALYVQGDYSKAVDTWQNINQDEILSLKIEDLPEKLARGILSIGAPAVALADFMQTRGVFSQAGLSNMIDRALDVNKLFSRDIPFYVTAHNKTEDKVAYFHINEEANWDRPERIKKILMASAAIPFVFDNVEIDDQVYYDGGIPRELKGYRADNSPVLPVYNQNCDLIIWVGLSQDDYQDYRRFPHSRILPILPTASLGGLLKGTLDFSGQGAKERMEQGYRDAAKIFEQLELFMTQEEAYEKLWQEVATTDTEGRRHKETMKDADEERTYLLEDIQTFNCKILEDDFTQFARIPAAQEIDLLAERTRNLLSDIERREVESWVEDFVEKNTDNRRDIENAVTEAVALLAPVESRANDLMDQGFLKRMMGAITGTNQRVSAANQTALAQAQFASITLIQRVQQKNLLAFEFTVAMNNQLHWVASEVAQVKKDLNQQSLHIYKSLALVFGRLRNEIILDRQRLEVLENRVNQLSWLTTIQVQQFEGVEYYRLKTAEKLICLANDFYHLTFGDWNVKELLTLKQALLTLRLEDTYISADEVVQAMKEKPVLASRMMDSLYKKSDSNRHPIIDVLQPEYGGNRNPSKKWRPIAEGLAETDLHPLYSSFYAWEQKLPAYSLLLEMMIGLKKAGYQVPNKQKTGELLTRVKTAYVNVLDELASIVKENKLAETMAEELVELKQEASNYRVTLPLIGSFSAGKSSLLNAYLQRDILEEQIKPTTAVATELHPVSAGEEKAKVHYLDGTTREMLLGETATSSEMSEEVLYMELHLNNPFLARHPDVILVDMPGLDSVVEAHNKAILNYIRDDSAFILCVETGQALKATTLHFLGEVKRLGLEVKVLMTKHDKRPPEELPLLTRTAADSVEKHLFRPVSIGKSSAIQKDLSGLHALVQEVEEEKDMFFAEKFESPMRSLAYRLNQSLTIRLNEENLSLHQLETKQNELKKKAEELRRIVAEERRSVMKQCQGQAASQVAGDVSSALNGAKNQLVEEAKAGMDINGRIQGIVLNTFRVSVENRGRKVFEKSAEKINRYISNQVYGGLGASPQVNPNVSMVQPISAKQEWFKTAGMALGGMLAMGPLGAAIGLLLVGVISFFKKQEQERQIREAIGNAIVQTETLIKPEAARVLTEQAEHFFEALEKKTAEMINQIQRDLSMLEEQMKQGQEEIDTARSQQQQALDKVQHLLQIPEGNLLDYLNRKATA